MTRKSNLVRFFLISSLFLLSGIVHSVDFTWDGSTDATWNTATNWTADSGTPGMGDTAIFNGAGNGNTIIDLGALGSIILDTLRFDTGSAAAYTIGTGAASSQDLTLDDSGTIEILSTVTNNQIVNAALLIQNATINNASTNATLDLNGTITGTSAGPMTLSIGGDGDINVNGAIADGAGGGTLSLTKNGTGTVLITATPSFTGGTSVTAGTLILQDAGIPDNRNYDVSSGATLRFEGGDSNNNFGVIELTGDGTFIIDADGITGSQLSQTSANSIISMGSGALIQVESGTWNFGGTGIGDWTANLADFQVDAGTTYQGRRTAVFVDSLDGAGTIGIGGPTGAVAGQGTGLRVGVDNGSGTFSGVIQNTVADGQAFSFEKFGTGTQILSGDNTYTGLTTIAGGILQIGNGGSSGTLGTGNTVNNASLVFSRTGSYTYAGDISGTGTVTQSGSGTVSLAGTNTYTGATAINVGRLDLTGSNTSAINVAAGASLGGEGSNTGTLTFADTSTLIIDATTAGAFLNQGVVDTSAATINVTLENGILDSNPITVLDFTGGSLSSGTGSFQLTNNASFRTPAFGTTGSTVTLTLGGIANTWTGGVDGDWEVAGAKDNWSSADEYFEGDSVTFGEGPTNRTVTIVGAGVNPADVTFSNTDVGGAYTINGGTLSAGGGISLTSSGDVTIDSVITGVTVITHSGTGTLTLGADNTTTGNHSVTSTGTIQVGSSSTAGSLGSGNVSLDLAGSNLVFDRSDDSAYGGVISGNGAVTKNGNGTLTLSGASTYDGNTNINAGTLVLTGSAIGSDLAQTPTYIIASGATLEYNGVGGTDSTTWDGAGTLSKTGAGTLNVISGGSIMGLDSGALIRVEEGTFQFGAQSPGSWADNFSDMEILGGATFQGRATSIRIDALDGAGTIGTGGRNGNVGLTIGVDDGNGNFSGVIENTTDYGDGFETATFDVVKTGTGTQILSGNNTYTGTTTISDGTLQIGNGAGSGTLGTGNTINNAALIINRTGSYTYSGEISGTGSVTHSGTGTTTLTGNHSYDGNTTVNAGQLNLTGTNTSSISVANMATLGGEVSTTGTLTLVDGAIISGVDGLTDSALTASSGLNLGGATASGITVNIDTIGFDAFTVIDYNGNALGGNWAAGAGAGFFTEGSVPGGSARPGAGFGDTGTAITYDLGFANRTWQGNNMTNSTHWSVGSATTGADNWREGDFDFFDGDRVLFDDLANSFTVEIQSNLTADSVVFDNDSNAYVINDAGSAALTVTNGITLNNDAAVTFNTDITSGVTFSGAGNATVEGEILASGSNGVTMNGSGIVTINGQTRYTGDTVVNSGRLVMDALAFAPSPAIDDRQFTVNGTGVLEFNVDGSDRGINESMDLNGNGTFVKTGDAEFSLFSSGSLIAMDSGGLMRIEDGIWEFGGNTPGDWTQNLADMQIDIDGTFYGRKTAIYIDVLTGEGLIGIGGHTAQTPEAARNIGLRLGVDNGSGTFNGVITDTTENGLTAAEIPHTLQKVGTGTQTLNGNNDYSGATTVMAGRLNLGGTNVSSITVEDGATFGGEGSTTGSLTLGGTTGVTLAIDPNTPAAFTSSGGLTVPAMTTVTFEAAPTGTGPITVLNYSGAAAGDTNFTLDSGGLTFRDPQFTDNVGTSITLDLGNQSIIWQGTENTFWDIDASDNWDSTDLEYFDGDLVTFSNTGAGSVEIQVDVNPGSVTFTNTSGAANDFTISSAAAQTLTSQGGIDLSSSGTATINSVIAGDTDVTVSGSGTLVLGADNTTTGNYTVSGTGTLVLGATNSTTGDYNVTSTGTLDIGGGTGAGELGTGNVSVAAGGTVAFNRTGTLNVANVISGDGQVSQIASGRTILTGTNTYTGNTNISIGDLRLGADNVIGDSSPVIQTGGNIETNDRVETLHSITATAGSIWFGISSNSGTGDITLLNNSQVNNLRIGNSGILRLADGITLTQAVGGIVDQLNDTSQSLTFDVGTGALANISGDINTGDGDGAINKTGAGTLRLTSNASSFGGGTVIENGTLEFNTIADIDTASSLGDADGADILQIGSDATPAILKMIENLTANTSNRAVQLGNAGGTIEVDNANQILTLTGIISNANTSGALTKTGPGTLILNGNNTYTGTTSVDAGRLDIGGTNVSAITVGASGTLGGEGSTTGGITFLNGSTLAINDKSNTGALAVTGGSTLDTSAGGIIVLLDQPRASTSEVIDLIDFSAGTWVINTNDFVVGSRDSIGVSMDIIQLTTGAAQTHEWDNDPTGNNVWDLDNAENWTSTDGRFFTDDSVEFTNTASGAITVDDSQGAIIANVVTFSNTTGSDYTFNPSGSSTITATGGISVTDSGNVTFNTVLAGATGITHGGTGTIILAADNTATGNNSITSTGIVQVGDGGMSGTISGDFAIGAGGTLIFDRSDDSTYAGVISGLGDVIKEGAGTLTFTGASTYGGTTNTNVNINEGTLRLTGSALTDVNQQPVFIIAQNAFLQVDTPGTIGSGDGNFDRFDLSGAGTFRKTGGARFTNISAQTEVALLSDAQILVEEGEFRFGGGTPGDWSSNLADMTVSSGAIFDGRATEIMIDSLDGGGTVGTGGLQNSVGLTIGVDGGGGNFTGVIQNAVDWNQASYANAEFNLVKTGNGTQILAGNNTYDGTTTIDGGTLILNGDNSLATGAVTVNSGGTLGGIGTIGGSTTVNGGTHTAGTVTGAGTQTFNNGLAYQDGSTITWNLINGGATQGSDWDLFNVTSGDLNFNDGLDDSRTFTIVDDSTFDFFGVPDSTTQDFLVWQAASVVGFDANDFMINYSGGGKDLRGGSFMLVETGPGVVLRFTAVPEPSTFTLMGIGLGFFGWLVRRRRKRAAPEAMDSE